MNDVPNRADVVVIGGGVIGCSVAYHLARAGAGDVILLERGQLGCGTTWHSAGNITWKPNEIDGDMVLYAFELVERLPDETGIETGWRWTGRLFLARSERPLRAFAALAGAAEAAGVQSRMLDPNEAAEANPLLDPASIVGAWHNPRSGRLDPANYTEALARGARRRGARIVEGCGVTDIVTDGDRVSGVATADGTIAAGAVVVCAGLWSRNVAARAGAWLAQWPTEHFYVIADPRGGLPADMPSFICPEALIYGREDAGRFLVGCFDEDAKTLNPNDLAEEFSFSLLNEDWDKVYPYFETAGKLFPALADAPIHSFINGPETFTPDTEPLIGPADGTRGLYICSGMNSRGITLAAGAGRIIADMVGGRTPRFDATPFAPDRFGAMGAEEARLEKEISASVSRGYKSSNT